MGLHFRSVKGYLYDRSPRHAPHSVQGALDSDLFYLDISECLVTGVVVVCFIC